MANPWDSKGRLASNGLATGSNPWDTQGGTPASEASSTLQKVGRLASFMTSGEAFIGDTSEALTGSRLDIKQLPWYLEKPIDLVVNPLGIASLASAAFTGGTSLAALGTGSVAKRVAGRAVQDIAGGLVGGAVGQAVAENVPGPDWLKASAGIAAGAVAGGAAGGAIGRRLPRAYATIDPKLNPAIDRTPAEVDTDISAISAQIKQLQSAGVKDTDEQINLLRETQRQLSAEKANLTGPIPVTDPGYGLDPVDRFNNWIKRLTGKGTVADAQTKPITDAMEHDVRVVNNIANETRARVLGDLAERTDIKYGEYGKGKATLIQVDNEWDPLQDVADATYDYDLSDSQLDFIRTYNTFLNDIRRQYIANGGKTGIRPSTKYTRGGFYLPRGVEEEDAVAGMLRYERSRIYGGRPDAAKDIVYSTMREGLEEGVVYPPIEDAIADYVSGMGRAIIERNATNKLLGLKDTKTGARLFRLPEERIDPELRKKYLAAEEALASAQDGLTASRAAVNETTAAREALAALGIEDTSVAAKIAELDDALKTHTVTMTEAKTTLDDLLAQFGATEREYNAALRNIRYSSELDVVDGLVGMKDMMGPAAVTKGVNEALNPTDAISRMAKVSNNLSGTLRTFHALGDLSDFGRLGANALMHPFDYFKGIQTGYKSMFSKGALGQDFKNINMEYAAAGLPYTTSKIAALGGVVGEVDLKLPDAIKAYRGASALEKLSEFSQNGISSMRQHMIKTEILNRHAAGQTIDDDLVRHITKSISLTTGAAIHKPVKNASLLIQFPNWFQSQIEFLIHGAAGNLPGASMESKYAADALRRLVVFGLASTYIGNAVQGHETEVKNGIPLLHVGDTNINVFGAYGSLVQGAYSALKPGGSIEPLLRSRINPLGAIGWDLFSGETYIGAPARFDDPSYWMKAIGPYGVTGLMQEGEADSKIAQFFGVRATNRPSWQEMQDLAEETMGKQWEDLTPAEKKRFQEGQPELASQIQTETETRASRGDKKAQGTLEMQKVTKELIAQQESLNTAYQSGQISGRQLREQLNVIAQAAANRKDQIRKDYGMASDKAPSEIQAGLNKYYDLYTLADSGILQGGTRTGIVDWDAFAEMESRLMAELTPLQQKAIQDRISTRSPELDWFYENRDLINSSGYFEAQDLVVNRMKSTVQHIVPGAETYTDLRKALQVAEREGNRIRFAQVNALIRSVNAQVQPIHAQITRQNPLVYRALVENGYVDQAKSRPMAATIR